MKIIIFGGNGFVGKSLCAYFTSEGAEVYAVSRSTNDSGNTFRLDITKAEEFNRINIIPDLIINCASKIPQAGKTSANPEFVEEMFRTNVLGALNIANWARQHNVPKVINCSTLVVVKKPWPNPLTEEDVALPEGVHVAYCMSKLSQEQIMNEALSSGDTKIIHARLSAVYGPQMQREGILFTLSDKLKDNQAIHLQDGDKITFDFIHVTDVCRAIAGIAGHSFDHAIVNLASGKPVSLNHLCNELKHITSSDSHISDSQTDKPKNEANISVERLKHYIGNTYNSFIPLEEGLKELI